MLNIWAEILGKTQVSGKYCQRLFDHARQSAKDALKTVSKRAIQKAAEATGELIGNKIADKITKVSRSLPQNSSEIKDIYL